MPSTDFPSSGASSAWGRAEPPPAPPAPRSRVERALGGPPALVLLRLLVLSFLVGALLMWLDLRPQDVLYAAERFARRIWSLGFDAIREVGDYVVAGALIVVPIYAIARLFNLRTAR